MVKTVFVNSIEMHKDGKYDIPLGILSLATVLKNKSYDVEIVDFNYLCYKKYISRSSIYEENLSIMRDYILKLEPSIVSFYTICNSYPNSIILAKLLKEKNPLLKIIFGGPHASLTAKLSLEAFNWIDIIGIGEGENTIIPIIESIKDNLEPSNIPGLAYRKGEEIIYNEKAKLISNLDDLPYLDYSLIDLENIETIPMDSGRGCPYGCTYCSTKTFWERKFRSKSTSRIIKEIKYLSKNYNKRKFVFVHDLFTLDKSKVIEFCNSVLNENLKIEWTCSARIDTLNEEILIKMSEAGCSGIYLGIETGSQRMQQVINKNLILDNIWENFDLLVKYNLKPIVSCIYGFPDETIEDVDQTLKLIQKLIQKGINFVQLHLLTALPGTEMFEAVKDKLEFTPFYSDFADGVDINYAKDMIIKNPGIFPQFYNLNTELRNELLFLDRFISYFCTILSKQLRITYNILMYYYKNSLLQLFLDFKKYVPDFATDFLLNTNLIGETDNNEFILRQCSLIERFIDNVKVVDNLKLIKEVYKFEIDIFKFIYIKNDNEEINEYSFDVYKLKALGFNENIGFEKPIKLKFYKATTGNLIIKRITK